MSSLTITTRTTASGPRYVVRFRLGGRSYPIQHAGSFKTLKEAKTRRDLVAGELAAGRNPADTLHALLEHAAPRRIATVSEWADRYLASRIDLDANTKRNYRTALKKVGETFGGRDPNTITVDDVAGWVGTLAETHKAGTIQLYLIAFRLLLDYAAVDPNPARDPRVKLPKRVREEPQPPPGEHVEAILEAIGKKWKLLFVTLEQGGLRLGEAVGLRWGDIDLAGLRLRLPRSATKRDRARWVYLPEWLMQKIDESCPLEDRTPERKVFQGITEASAYQAMLRACQNAGVPHYHPHDLRHRRITIWHQSGVPARELAERAGHARPSMSLDVYSHVMPADEVQADRFLLLLSGSATLPSWPLAWQSAATSSRLWTASASRATSSTQRESSGGSIRQPSGFSATSAVATTPPSSRPRTPPAPASDSLRRCSAPPRPAKRPAISSRPPGRGCPWRSARCSSGAAKGLSASSG